MRGGGQGGPAPRGPGVWGAREESKNTVVGQAGFFFFLIGSQCMGDPGF